MYIVRIENLISGTVCLWTGDSNINPGYIHVHPGCASICLEILIMYMAQIICLLELPNKKRIVIDGYTICITIKPTTYTTTETNK